MGQSTENCPRRPRSDGIRALSDHETKRREAVWELFHSEVIYLMSHLLVLKEVRLLCVRFARNYRDPRRTYFIPSRCFVDLS